MQNAVQLLQAFEARGVVFTLDGATLHTRPAGILNNSEREAVRTLSFAIVALLKFREASAARIVEDRPGLVRCDRELSRLWHAAEISAACRLNINGAPIGGYQCQALEMERIAA